METRGRKGDLSRDSLGAAPPGRAPVNEDVVEYFLFENHKGYCVHFASAATLMYRALGFPARYASGYAVQPSDFVRQEDGVWRAQVTDESAHAWTEIFLEDYGWTPVEVTPASDGNYSTSYPGVDTEALEEIISVMNLDTYVPDAAEDAENAVTAPDGGENSGGSKTSDGFTPGRYHDLILIAATVSTESLLLIPLFLDYRKLRRRRQIERMNCRKVFGLYLRLLHKAGYMSGYNGTERNFAEKLSESISCVRRDEAERIVSIVGRAACGRGETPEEEEEFVRNIYFRSEGWIRGQSGKAKHRK